MKVIKISLTGIILKGRYCVLEKIKKGGEGSLYLARDLELGIMWAVKEIPLSEKREAKLLRLLDHPSIPRMIDYAEREDFCYLVMEYIKGKSLEDELLEGKKYSLEEILEIGFFLCEVLEYLHTRKPPVYYGDLKPGNIMRSAKGKLYLVDLGSAVFGYADRVQDCLGTRGYAAPEQYQGKVGAESDVYAFGKTLQKLCGNRVYGYGLLYPAFGRLLWKCIQKKSSRRYQKMDQVKKTLGKVKESKARLKMTAGISLACILCFLLFFVFFLNPKEKPDFTERLSKVTSLYYTPSFLRGEGEERRRICESVEEKLQALLEEYPKEEAQRRVLLLLALNGEMQGREDLAVFYYEQMKVYHWEFRETYGEYGIYLWRMGEEEKSAELWEEYKDKEAKGQLSGIETKNTKAWISLMGEEDTENEKAGE